MTIRFVWSLRAALAQLRFVLAIAAVALGFATTAFAQANPNQGPGGPILVVTSSQSTYGTYYAEILRTEGFNAFAVADIATVSPSTLAAYDVVLLAKMPLTTAQVTTLSDWVTAGGNLIAMGPSRSSPACSGSRSTGTLSNGYLLVDTSANPGNGIVGQTIQFHGDADLYTLNGATRLPRCTATPRRPPPTRPSPCARRHGGGQAAAFAYDLATSIVYTRQGNPAWARRSATASRRSARTTSSSAMRPATRSRTGST